MTQPKRILEVLLVVLFVTPAASGQSTFDVVTAFDAPFPHGAIPAAGVIQAVDGEFYGTTRSGGLYGRGTVFKLDAAGTLVTLHSFTGGDDGGEPYAAVIQASDGAFYGTTAAGGTQDHGTVFKIDATGMLTTIHSFVGSDGNLPRAGLVQGSDGDLYGTTVYGGAAGFGTVFRLDASGTLTTLHSFTGGAGGKYPFAEVIQATDGNFYGVTQEGGTLDKGTLFRLDAAGNFAVVHHFAGGSEGATPLSRLLQSNDGNVYGTTIGGGSALGYGTVFKLDPAGSFTTIHQFSGLGDGVKPLAGLIQATDGFLYGTTTYAGGPYLGGTVFRMTAAGVVTTLHSFAGGGIEGAIPAGGVIQASDGDFYGATEHGGGSGVGIVFRLNAISATTTVYSFPGNTSGANPRGLLQATDATIYGTTLSGGPSGGGAIYTLDHDGSATPIHDFYYGSEGPIGNTNRLIQAADGDFYGATFGGASNYGTVFRMDAAGNITTIHVFSNWSEGAYPFAGVIQGADGSFYGTTISGGTNSNGTVFRLDRSGAFTVLHSFASTYDGSGAPLVQGGDGSLYGTTRNGGDADRGTVFKIGPSGTFTILHSFSGGGDGATPTAGVIEGDDGAFYGTTSAGGNAQSAGTVFRLDADGTLTTLHAFTRSIDGASPSAELIQAADGRFLGTTAYGGQRDKGTIFIIDSEGTFATLHHFTGDDGANPRAALIQLADGRFFGSADGGGPAGGGVLFSLILTVPASPKHLRASAGDSQVQLDWQQSQGADVYRVKRSPDKFGPYVTIADVTDTTFTDTPLSNGVRYYYVVTALNDAGESTASKRVFATPTARVRGKPTP